MSETEVKAHIGFEVDDKPLETFRKGIESLKEGLFGLTATLVESGVALYETVVKTSEAAEAAHKLGQSTGVGAEKIQELQYAAKMADVDVESMSNGLRLLSRNLFATATAGKDAGSIFSKMGINIRQANGQIRPADDVLAQIADKFKTLPDGPEKTGLAMKFFGRQGAALIPVLNKGRDGLKEMAAEAHNLGVILSEEDIEKGKAFQDSLKHLMSVLTGIRNIVAIDLMPDFTAMVDSIVEWFKANRQLIKSNLQGFLKATATYLKVLLATFLTVGNAIAGFANILGGAENATKLFLFAIGLLGSASILFGIGKLVQATMAAAEGFALADAAALLIPIAIGLAIIAIGLLIEDVYTFASGGDSLIGRLLAKIPEVAKAFGALFSPILEPIFAIIYGITNGIGSWKDVLKNVGVLLVNIILLPLRAILETFGGIMSIAGRLTGINMLKNAGSAVQDFGGKMALDAVVPGTTPNANTANNANININSPTTVTVPPNTPPALVGDKVSDGVAMGVENHLRQAQRATQTAVAY